MVLQVFVAVVYVAMMTAISGSSVVVHMHHDKVRDGGVKHVSQRLKLQMETRINKKQTVRSSVCTRTPGWPKLSAVYVHVCIAYEHFVPTMALQQYCQMLPGSYWV